VKKGATSTRSIKACRSRTRLGVGVEWVDIGAVAFAVQAGGPHKHTHGARHLLLRWGD